MKNGQIEGRFIQIQGRQSTTGATRRRIFFGRSNIHFFSYGKRSDVLQHKLVWQNSCLKSEQSRTIWDELVYSSIKAFQFNPIMKTYNNKTDVRSLHVLIFLLYIASSLTLSQEVCINLFQNFVIQIFQKKKIVGKK